MAARQPGGPRPAGRQPRRRGRQARRPGPRRSPARHCPGEGVEHLGPAGRLLARQRRPSGDLDHLTRHDLPSCRCDGITGSPRGTIGAWWAFLLAGAMVIGWRVTEFRIGEAAELLGRQRRHGAPLGRRRPAGRGPRRARAPRDRRDGPGRVRAVPGGEAGRAPGCVVGAEPAAGHRHRGRQGRRDGAGRHPGRAVPGGVADEPGGRRRARPGGRVGGGRGDQVDHRRGGTRHTPPSAEEGPTREGTCDAYRPGRADRPGGSPPWLAAAARRGQRQQRDGERERASAANVTGTVTVFAAASLTESFTQIGKDFEAANPGATVTFNFGASSALATQINQGAPADVFASAAPANMEDVTDAGNGDGKPDHVREEPARHRRAQGQPEGDQDPRRPGQARREGRAVRRAGALRRRRQEGPGCAAESR